MKKRYHEKRRVPVIWNIALGTVFFAAITATSWHFGEMRDMHYKQRGVQKTMETDLTRLSAYRDIIAASGTPAGKEYLESIPKRAYEF
jgi:hypothetical protein